MYRLLEQVKALCLSSLLALAFGILMAVVMLAGVGSIIQGWQNRHRAEDSRRFNEWIVVTDDGQVAIDNNWESFDLDHTPIEKIDVNSVLLNGGRLVPEDLGNAGVHWQWGMAALINPVAANVHGSEEWFLVVDGPDDDLGYFEGHDRKTLQRVGYIGTNGFQETKPSPAERFAIDLHALRRNIYESYNHAAPGVGGTLLFHDGHLTYVDFDTREITPLLDNVVDSTSAGQRRDGRPAPIRVAARTTDSIEVFDGDGKFVSRFPIPEPIRTRPITFYPLEEEAVMVAEMTDWNPDPDPTLAVIQQEMIIARVGIDGQVRDLTPVTLDRRNYGSSDIPSFIAAAVPSPVWTFGTYLPVAAANQSAWAADVTYGAAFQRLLIASWPGILIMLLVTAFAAWKTWRHHRHTNEPGTWVWVLFTLVAGLPGYVGYRLHRPWPRHAPLPAIEPTGTEIIA